MHKKLKINAINRGMNVKEYLLSLVINDNNDNDDNDIEEIHSFEDFNEETQNAMLKKPNSKNTILITSVKQYKKLEKNNKLYEYDFIKYKDSKLSFECSGI